MTRIGEPLRRFATRPGTTQPSQGSCPTRPPACQPQRRRLLLALGTRAIRSQTESLARAE
eukprot:6265017-Alexandrium_andersonii.AAC.1